MSYGDDDNYMTWSNNSPSSGIYDMYSSFLTYFERLNQLYRDYALNIQRINDSYKESIRIIETINDANKEYIENYSKMNQLYKQHFEDMQRMNQQWLNLLWNPFMGEEKQKHQEHRVSKVVTLLEINAVTNVIYL
jgi:hypothetical protein